MKYEILFSDKFYEDVKKLRKGGEKVALKKIDSFISELEIHPYTGTGQPEQLSYDRSGQWSRRISQKHRLVYTVDDEKITVQLIAAYGHYGDK